MMGGDATGAALADCSRNLGLDRPLAVQYVDYLWRSVRFDFGTSFRQGYPVSEYIGRMFITVNQRPQSVVREIVSNRTT